jgi:hypothetical protein
MPIRSAVNIINVTSEIEVGRKEGRRRIRTKDVSHQHHQPSTVNVEAVEERFDSLKPFCFVFTILA